MQNTRRFGIRSKLYVTVLITVLVILSVLSWVIYTQADQLIHESVVADLGYAKELMARQTYEVIEESAFNVNQLNRNGYIRQLMTVSRTAENLQEVEGYPQLIQTLNLVRESNPNLLNVYVGFDARNQLITHDEFELPPEFDMQARPWYQDAVTQGDVVLTPPYEDTATGEIVVTVATPITSSTGSLLGVAGVDITLQEIAEFMSSFQYKSSGYAALIDSDGTFVYHPDPDLILADPITSQNGWSDVAPHLLSGGTAMEEVMIQEQSYYISYTPIGIGGWSVAIAVPTDEALAASFGFRNMFLAAIVIAILILLALLYVVSGSIVKPIPPLLDSFRQAMEGNLTVRAKTTSNDEIGELSQEFNLMLEGQQAMIHSVIKTTDLLGNVVKETETNIQSLNTDIEEISATTQQLSAGMEETAASTEEMNATSAEIESAVGSIAKKTEEGAVSAQEIKKRAESLKTIARQSSDKAQALYQTTQQEMKKAIEDSAAIEEINVLSKAILAITEQTNLLALNAAIEAARAGEAGKGFAVVAEEIRKLAESSERSVQEIQQVTQNVVSAVQQLVVSARQLLGFMDQQVFKDYETLVNTGEQYSQDADFVNELVADFSTTSHHLLESIQAMLKAIEEVTQATNEGAEGTTNIAERTGTVMDRSIGILSQMNQLQESADNLKQNVSRFQV